MVDLPKYGHPTESRAWAPTNERQLQDDTFRRLIAVGTQCYYEVPFMGLSIDLVLVTPEGVVHSIECKLRKWQHALERQTKYHGMGADYCWVLMPPRRITTKLRDAFAEQGTGLYVWEPTGWPMRQVIPARTPSPAPMRVYREILLGKIRCASGNTGPSPTPEKPEDQSL